MPEARLLPKITAPQAKKMGNELLKQSKTAIWRLNILHVATKATHTVQVMYLGDNLANLTLWDTTN